MAEDSNIGNWRIERNGYWKRYVLVHLHIGDDILVPHLCTRDLYADTWHCMACGKHPPKEIHDAALLAQCMTIEDLIPGLKEDGQKN